MRRGPVAFAALEVALLAAVPALAWIGFRTVLDTTEGQAVDPELDPTEPGYEAFLEPTPMAVAAGVDEAGALSWLTVLALGGPSEQGGSVLFIPRTTLVEDGGSTLAEVWADDGQARAIAVLADLLDAGFDDSVVLPPERVAALLGPVAPLQLVLADEVEGFEAGDVALQGDRVAELLLRRGEGESDLARLVRHEVVWRSWLAAVAASEDPDAVPGEATSGVGRFVRGLAAGTVAFDTAPVTAIDGPEAGDEVFEADVDALRALLTDRVPFPVAARPGGRPRVRVLDGVGVSGLALQVARDAVRAGGQVTVIGNADRFDIAASRVVYFDGRVATEAEAVADALGVAEVQQAEGPNPNDLVDLTVVVGSDLAGAYGAAGG